MSMVTALMRRYLSEILADPFAPESLGKAMAIRDYIAMRPELLEDGEQTMLDEFMALVAEAQQVATS